MVPIWVRWWAKKHTYTELAIVFTYNIKTILTDSSIKIFGNPEIKIKNKIEIKNYLKDHRVFMMSVISALTFGGHWKLHDPDSINSSFPSFLKLINGLNK